MTFRRLKSQFYLSLCLFALVGPIKATHAVSFPGHTGGGHVVDGQLLDLLYKDKLTPLDPKRLEAYPLAKDRLEPLIKILPGLGWKLFSYFGKADWYYTTESVKCQSPQLDIMIKMAPSSNATPVACQNEVEVILQKEDFFSLDLETQSWVLIHELVRGYQIELEGIKDKFSFSDTAVIRMVQTIFELYHGERDYPYPELKEKLRRLKIKPWHDYAWATARDARRYLEMRFAQLDILESSLQDREVLSPLYKSIYNKAKEKLKELESKTPEFPIGVHRAFQGSTPHLFGPTDQDRYTRVKQAVLWIEMFQYKASIANHIESLQVTKEDIEITRKHLNEMLKQLL